MKVVELRTLKDLSLLAGKRVLIRADFDVIIKGSEIKEDFRIREALPTIRFVLQKGGLVRLVAHLGRPRGRIVPTLSLKKITGYLEKLLNKKVIFIRDPFAQKVFAKYNKTKEIILFENIRFWPGEEANDKVFAGQLSRWGDIYVNDAFASSHRRHASLVAIAKFLPRFAGFTLAKEVAALSKVLQNPAKPFWAILGGAKLETKLPLIKLFLKIADGVLLGGALLNTFFLNRGLEVKKSFGGNEKVENLRGIELNNKKLYLPFDVKVAKNPAARGRILKKGSMQRGEAIFDIGPGTVKSFMALLRKAKTVVWNGPLGLAEKKEFSYGTIGIARGLQKVKAFKVIGGGDTVAILRQYKALKGFSHISSGGGAMLEFLAGSKLPGIEVLKK